MTDLPAILATAESRRAALAAQLLTQLDRAGWRAHPPYRYPSRPI